MIINNNVKLIPIFNRNFDKKTDQLYEPLRHAIGSGSTLSSQKIKFQFDEKSGYPVSNLKNSNLQKQTLDQYNLKNSILIPVNKKLTITNNQNLISKAKSRSYRTLSVQNKIGTPIKQHLFKSYLPMSPVFKQIVYDYQNSKTTSIKSSLGTLSKQTTPKQQVYMKKTRSITCMMPTYHSIENQINNLQSQQNSQRKVSIKSRFIESSKNMSIKHNKIKEQEPKQEYYMEQYYQNTKKYKFNKDSIKSKPRQYQSNHLNKSNDYKYNLFNMLDEQVNAKCSTGLCTKNQVIAPKLKSNW